MTDILLIEDTATLGLSLELSLNAAGYSVTWVTTLEEARMNLAAVHPKLVILDLGLPDGDGLEFCQKIRGSGQILPVLILTARDSLLARVEGLSAGADDYMTKPFELPELLARVAALLRRQRWHGGGDQITIGTLEVDFQRRHAQRGGESVPLTEMEFKLLDHLVRHANQVVSREELLTQVWGQSAHTKTRTVDVFISRLRQILEADPANPQHLRNVRGVGYQLRLENEPNSSEI